jgi:hypothetical protein
VQVSRWSHETPPPTHIISVVQSDVAEADHVQQGSFAVVQPGYHARLATVAGPAVGGIDDLGAGEFGWRSLGAGGRTYRFAPTWATQRIVERRRKMKAGITERSVVFSGGSLLLGGRVERRTLVAFLGTWYRV